MELMHLIAKVSFTMVFVTWFFIGFCKYFDFEPAHFVKAIAVTVFLVGLVTGMVSIIWAVWAL